MEEEVNQTGKKEQLPAPNQRGPRLPAEGSEHSGGLSWLLRSPLQSGKPVARGHTEGKGLAQPAAQALSLPSG